MRAFHCSWMAFFTAFFIWFAIAPLLPEIQITLDLSKEQIWTSNICSVLGTIFMRFINGPLCDKYGARILMGVLLMGCSIPCACTGAVNSAGMLFHMICLFAIFSVFISHTYTWLPIHYINTLSWTRHPSFLHWTWRIDLRLLPVLDVSYVHQGSCRHCQCPCWRMG